jgi:hypothetical protein
MEFSRELRDGVMSGDITVSFRLWRRPKVKEGGRYSVGPIATIRFVVMAGAGRPRPAAISSIDRVYDFRTASAALGYEPAEDVTSLVAPPLSC